MSEPSISDVLSAAKQVLTTSAPKAKTAAAHQAKALFDATSSQTDGIWVDDIINAPAPPETPPRPPRPVLAPPGKMPRRRLTNPAGRIALLHAVAHIEFNAIDLAFDMALRFARDVAAAGCDARAFIDDWVRIGAEEADHFQLIEQRLNAYESEYGALPAHDGLWRAARSTEGDVLARLAIAPLVLEARGLDVTPAMIENLTAAGDQESADALRIIYRDEVGHVACGRAWFEQICATRGEAPVAAFKRLVSVHFEGSLKPPFNDEARGRAGLDPAFYTDG